jgi:hypothetical protein
VWEADWGKERTRAVASEVVGGMCRSISSPYLLARFSFSVLFIEIAHSAIFRCSASSCSSFSANYEQIKGRIKRR